MKFTDYNLHSGLIKNIVEMGFIRPTDIQFKAIPPILKGDDVMAVSRTGTGKTAAFAIPVIQKLLVQKRKIPGMRCLVMVPTRELALQIMEVFKSLSNDLPIRIFSVFGGVGQEDQVDALLEGVDILVATPGRILDLLHQGHTRLDALEVLILDEADRMLDKGFLREIQRLSRFLPPKRQTLFFSATIDKEIKSLAYSLVKNPIHIQLSPHDPVSKNIDHSVAYLPADHKRFFLERLIREHPDSKIIVFVRTKVRSERVSQAMERAGIKSITLHGDKEQEERNQVMEQFRKGIIRVLVATDVSARGIDIPDIRYVVNYDLPQDPEVYVHRIGRTGRGSSKGFAVSFCSPDEENALSEIAGFIGKTVKVLDIGRQDYEETMDFSETSSGDWRSLIREEEKRDSYSKRKKKKH